MDGIPWYDIQFRVSQMSRRKYQEERKGIKKGSLKSYSSRTGKASQSHRHKTGIEVERGSSGRIASSTSGNRDRLGASVGGSCSWMQAIGYPAN